MDSIPDHRLTHPGEPDQHRRLRGLPCKPDKSRDQGYHRHPRHGRDRVFAWKHGTEPELHRTFFACCERAHLLKGSIYLSQYQNIATSYVTQWQKFATASTGDHLTLSVGICPGTLPLPSLMMLLSSTETLHHGACLTISGPISF